MYLKMFSCIISASDNCVTYPAFVNVFIMYLHIYNFLKILPLDPLTDVTSLLLFEHCLNCLNVETINKCTVDANTVIICSVTTIIIKCRVKFINLKNAVINIRVCFFN